MSKFDKLMCALVGVAIGCGLAIGIALSAYKASVS